MSHQFEPRISKQQEASLIPTYGAAARAHSKPAGHEAHDAHDLSGSCGWSNHIEVTDLVEFTVAEAHDLR